MKRKFIIVLINLVITMISITGCSIYKNEDPDIEQKVDSELSYIDTELISIANELNNVSYANYKINIEEFNEKESKEQVKEEKSSTEENGNKKNDEEDKKSSEQDGDKQDLQKQEGSKNDDFSDSKFTMELNNILGNNVNINWDELKGKVENLYSVWTIIELDLREVGISAEELEEFSNSIDKLAIAVKSEDEYATIDEVTNLYSILTKLTKTSQKKEEIFKCKYDLLISYKYVMLEDWEKVQNCIQILKNDFMKIMDQKEKYTNKSINIESANIIIRELSDVKVIKEKDIFFIKYKNLMQEFNAIG